MHARGRRHSFTRICFVTLAAGAFLLGGATAVGEEISTTFFMIEVESTLGAASWSIASAEVDFDQLTHTWSWAGPEMQLGEVATLNHASLVVVGDPQIALGFAITAGPADITVTISSALLSFDPLVNPVGAASMGVTLTECGGDPAASLVGLAGDAGSIYAAYHNVPPGSVFAEFVPGLATGTTISGAGSTGGWVPIADTVGSMQALYSFGLSAGDEASSTSNFMIVPEPLSLALLGLGVITLARRRR